MKKLFILFVLSFYCISLFALDSFIKKDAIDGLYYIHCCDDDIQYDYQITTYGTYLDEHKIKITFNFSKTILATGAFICLKIEFKDQNELDNFIKKYFDKKSVNDIGNIFSEIRKYLIDSEINPVYYYENRILKSITYELRLNN